MADLLYQALWWRSACAIQSESLDPPYWRIRARQPCLVPIGGRELYNPFDYYYATYPGIGRRSLPYQFLEISPDNQEEVREFKSASEFQVHSLA